MPEQRTKTFRLLHWRVVIVYERSPFVERWGYRPLVIGLAVMAALVAVRINL